MTSELEWDAEYSENTSDVPDISLTQTSATPSVDADLPKKVSGKICYTLKGTIQRPRAIDST